MLEHPGAYTTITSTDRTPIALESVGDGPVVVLVSGALANRTTMLPVAKSVAGSLTAVCYDRRGRGDSGDADAYAIEREIEDLAAVIDHVGGKAMVYGHSSGAALALRAAVAGVPITRLAVWEPPILVGSSAAQGALLEEVIRLVATGERERALETFLVGALKMPPRTLDRAKEGPVWEQMLRMVPTLQYDIVLTSADGSAPMPPLGAIDFPVLALAGGASPPIMRACAAAVATQIAGARQAAVADQLHNPSNEVLAPILIGFFTTPNL